jgi:hypothetical protein
MPIQKSPETGALPAMATRQCQKSGNGFPPPAAFLPLGTIKRTPCHLVGAGLLAMNDDTVCLDDRGAWIASKPAPTRARGVSWKLSATKKRSPKGLMPIS